MCSLQLPIATDPPLCFFVLLQGEIQKEFNRLGDTEKHSSSMWGGSINGFQILVLESLKSRGGQTIFADAQGSFWI